MSSQVDKSVQGKQQATTDIAQATTGLKSFRGMETARRLIRSWNISASIPSARCRWMRCRRPTAAIPELPWRWRLWRSCCGTATCDHNPRNPHWPGRDRFILSNGHASMLLYSMLYLTGYDLTARRHQAVPPVGFEDPRAS